jgi:hypothetical protein
MHNEMLRKILKENIEFDLDLEDMDDPVFDKDFEKEFDEDYLELS